MRKNKGRSLTKTISIPICCEAGNGSFWITQAKFSRIRGGTEKQARRKEESLKKETDQILKTIGQLTLDRDFLQDCFRQCGLPVPVPGAEK